MGLVEWPSFTYCTKFATVSGAFCSSSSRVMVPMLVWRLTMLFPLLDGFLRRLGGFGLDHARAFDHHRLHRHVLVRRTRRGRHGDDLLHHVHPGDDLAEYAISGV